jgi:hypothetical protein
MSSPDCFSQVLSCKDEFVRVAAERVLAQPLRPLIGLTPKMIPVTGGVYIFYQIDEAQPFHIGESKNLQQRIYRNQLRGTIGQSPLKRKAKKLFGLDGEGASKYIFANLQVRFLAIPLGRIEIEDYLNDQFGIVESNPDA